MSPVIPHDRLTRDNRAVNITFDFSSKSVLVSGAAQGIGHEIANLSAPAQP